MEAIKTSALLLLAWALYYWAWWPYSVAALRSRLSKLRHDLFLLASEGRVSSKDPAYKAVDNTIRSYVEAAERMTTTNFLLVKWFRDRQSPPDLREIVQKSPNAELLGSFFDSANVEAFRHFIRTSPIGWYWVVKAILTVIGRDMIDAVKNPVGMTLRSKPKALPTEAVFDFRSLSGRIAT